MSSYRFYVAFLLFLCSLSVLAQKERNSSYYFPESSKWETRRPAEVEMNQQKLESAISFAQEHESKMSRDLEQAHYQSFGREPFGDAIGPFRERGGPAGLIIRHGYIVAKWGDPDRVDMTFSVTKSLLSSVIGVAYDKGLIKNVHDTMRNDVGPIEIYRAVQQDNKGDRFGQSSFIYLFETPHNKKVTWDHMLRQTSDWEGTLWGKPEWADRPGDKPSEWQTRPRREPGTSYEYNDVRVNALALATLNVWRKPLPQVLKENIMDPIGASSTWRWYGYENAWVVVDGTIMQAVGGGGHWGGGVFINAMDMARFGYLTLRRGKWKNQQLLSEAWVKMALTPTPAQPTYGFMNWFLNTEKKYLPSAPLEAFAHIGNGTNMIYVDPTHDLVVVARWIDNSSLDGFIAKVLEALEPPQATTRK